EIARRWHEEYGTPDNLPYRVTSKKKEIKNGKEKKGADITQPSPRSLRISSPSINNIFPLLQPDPEIQFAMREKTFPSVFRRLFRTKLNLPKPNMLKTGYHHNVSISGHNEENTMIEKLAEKFIKNYLRKVGNGLVTYNTKMGFDDEQDTETEKEEDDEGINLRKKWLESVVPTKKYVPPDTMPNKLREAIPGAKIQTPVVSPNIIKGKGSKPTQETVPNLPNMSEEEAKILSDALKERSKVVPPKKKPMGGVQQAQPVPPKDKQPAPAGPHPPLPNYKMYQRDSSPSNNLEMVPIPPARTPADQSPSKTQTYRTAVGPRPYIPGGSNVIGGMAAPHSPSVGPRMTHFPKISSDNHSNREVEKYGSDYYHRLNLILKSILGLTSDSDIL
ncbi:MAG: hypothetical protein QXP01_03945, partial [Candidatus Hadarchaeum sp.]